MSSPPSHSLVRAAGGRVRLALAIVSALALGLFAWVVVTGQPADTLPDTGRGAADARLAAQTASPPTADTTPSAVATTPSALATTPTPTPTTWEDHFTIAASGDQLIHMPVTNDATAADGSIDFERLTTHVKPWIEGADLALCQMEVPIAPKGTAPSGYPVFAAPRQLIQNLKNDGWDGCSTASNHSLDKGLAGVKSTLDLLDKAGMGHAGTSRSAKEEAAPQWYILERGGRTIRIAHFAATYGTNGIPAPADAPWAVTVLDAETIVERARQARADGADFVIATVHAGQEFSTTPDAQQREVAEALAASGVVDLYVGHHVHVPQPIELLPGGPNGKGMWTAYGLGNFISNQYTECCTAASQNGVLMLADVTVPASGPLEVSGLRWVGLTTDRLGGHQVYALRDLVKKGTSTLSAAEARTRLSLVRQVVGDQASEAKNVPPEPSGPDPEVVSKPH